MKKIRSAKFVKDLAVISLPVKAGEDHSAKKGYLVKLVLVSGVYYAAINDSVSVPAFGVILDGENAGGNDSVGVLGGNLGSVKFKAGGAITPGAKLQQKVDGTVIVDDVSTLRVIVGMGLEVAATDELFEGIACFPNKVPALVATSDGSDAGTTQTLANALKVAFNTEIAGE